MPTVRLVQRHITVCVSLLCLTLVLPVTAQDTDPGAPDPAPPAAAVQADASNPSPGNNAEPAPPDPDGEAARAPTTPRGTSDIGGQCDGQTLRFDIPYQWSRSPGDEERVQIRRTLHTAATLAFARRGLADWDDETSGLSILSASLTGYSSPESSAGARSLALDALDPVNLRVARVRAQAIRGEVARLFADQGLVDDAITATGNERQFSDGQWMELHREATGEDAIGGEYDAKAVFELITRFKGDRQSLDEGQRATVAAALADKKSVEVTLCYSLYGDVDTASESTHTAGPANAGTAAEIVHPIIRELDAAEAETPDQSETIDPAPGADETTETTDHTSADTETARIKAFVNEHALALGIGGALLLALILAIALLLRRASIMRLESEALPRRKRRPWNAPHARITAIMSGKGGTGKSSISSSLAFALAHTGYRTLLVDLDLFTHGLTFLNQGRLSSREDLRPVKDIFEHAPSGEGDSGPMPTPLPVRSGYTGGNLYLLPSIRVEGADLDSVPLGNDPLELNAPYNELLPFATRLRAALERLGEIHDFDYIILDTRGGADHTSVGAALAAGSFILVTESDKPSWAISDRLLETVHGVRESSGLHTQGLGFVINKNALPTEQIERHLHTRWRLEHLGTLPYDVEVVRSFEQAGIPVEDEPTAKFSGALFELVHRLHKAPGWDVAETLRVQRAGAEKKEPENDPEDAPTPEADSQADDKASP
ncbi:MAG: ParA family protein [Gammaproteobacteria bacterium]